MTDKEARIQAIQYFYVIHESLQSIHQLACEKLLTKDNDKFKESLNQLNKKILAHIVEIGLIDGYNWKDQTHILDKNKFIESFEGKLETIENKCIFFEIQRLLGIEIESDIEEATSLVEEKKINDADSSKPYGDINVVKGRENPTGHNPVKKLKSFLKKDKKY